MSETPDGTTGGPVSDRMQALLSRAVEEQVSEQRAVSTVLAELRAQVGALSDGVRLTASDASVERLGGVVSTVVADLRTSTSLLGQRIEALSKRVEAVAQDTAAPTEQAAVRLAALQGDIAAQSESVDRMQVALETLAGFPAALAALQKDVAGLHDRVQPLAEIRSTVGDIGARTTSSLDALRPQLDALQTKVDAIGTVPDPERLRDAVVDALGSRLDKLEEAASRPVIGPEVLRSGLGDLRASIDGAMGDRLEELTAGLGAVENRLGQVGERLADVGDAAGGVPALSTELRALAGRVEELQALHGSIAAVGTGVAALRDDSTGTALTLGIASLRDDIEHLGERITETAPAPVEEIAALVSQRVADRLVETLAPRIADVVLTRVSAALVTQLGEALSPRVKADTELVVRTATADSERRVLAHVDEAVLALAEALLRRRRGGRAPAVALPAASDEVREAPFEEPVQDIVDKINAVESEPEPEPDTDSAPAPASAEPVVVEVPAAPAEAPAPAKPSVTTGLAPAAAPAPPAEEAPVLEDVPAEVEAREEPEEEPVAELVHEPVAETVEELAPKPASAPRTVTAGRPDLPKRPTVAPPKPAVESQDALKPAVRSKAKAAVPPMKKPNRPGTKPPSKPILDRTPDLHDDQGAEPVRSTAPRPRPVSRPAAPPAQPTAPVVFPSADPPSPLSRPVTPAAKRKPWWRPGG